MIFLPIAGLAGLNLLMLFSLVKNLFWRQFIFWVLGIGLFFLVRKIVPKNFFQHHQKIYWMVLAFLFLPILIGNIVRGSSRWIGVGDFGLQPSEIAKPFLIGSFAYLLSRTEIENFSKLVKILLLAFLPTAVIMLQPDLGSAGVLFLSLLLLIFLKKPQINWWLYLTLSVGVLFLVGHSWIIKPYQQERIITFLNPEADPLGKGYNAIQAQIAISSGGFWGKGFSQGGQTQLKFLPEKHTDFILASLGEELGLWGLALTIILYFCFFWLMLKKVGESEKKFDYYLRLGLFFQIFFQSSINIAMNLQLFPVVGLPLPFLSYGGSSLLTTLLSLGFFCYN